MKLNYNDMLLLAIWEYNRRQDEDLTLELFQETFGQVPGAHFHDKWVHYYNRNLLMMAAYFRGEEENGQKFCDMITRQVERYTQNRRRTELIQRYDMTMTALNWQTVTSGIPLQKRKYGK